jgi:hypothetical protein
MLRVAVTGAAGEVGRGVLPWLCRDFDLALLSRGADTTPLAFQNRQVGKLAATSR